MTLSITPPCATRRLLSQTGGRGLRLSLLLLVVALSGCAGVQGGNEGEENEVCTYDREQLNDPRQVAAGFSLPPRELFSPAFAALAGTVSGRFATLQLDPGLHDLSASYARRNQAECAPRLSALSSAALTLESAGSAAISAAGSVELELRGEALTANVSLASAGNAELAALAQELSARTVNDATLQVVLSDFTPQDARSTWFWSLQVQCGSGCSKFEEVSWAPTTLIRSEP